MTRPTTRSKNKRQRQGDDDSISQILRKIHATSEITDDDVNQLYMISKPVCQGCRGNSKDNPNCFCGLVPPSNGHRKSGLWQKTSDIVQALGPDPTHDLRASIDSPAGLTNLGATCYANSILQCLYMNKSFREGVFLVEPEILKQHPVLDQLARLFVQLYASKMAFVDSAPFIQTLELDNGVQQDSHEFLTLLLSLLEQCLSHSQVSKARTIVQDLFRGRVSHVTTCSKCGKDSEVSSNMEDFYELELNVKGLKSLDESLNDYLSVEELHGDNQYFCDSCETRVDATRSIKLRSLPDVLNLQLKRCIFLPKTTTKKKITSVICFPGELDMRQRLYEPSQSEFIYDLSAVLIHKGTAANSGHYIAHIKDDNTGQWWEFDDENVTNLGFHPFGEGSSSSTVKSVLAESEKRMDVVAKAKHVDVVHLQSSESGTSSHVEIFSSSDAYMLMYSRRCVKGNDEKELMSCDEDSIGNGDEICRNHSISLPSHLYEEVKVLNASYLDASQQYEVKKKRELDRITERRQEVRLFLSQAPLQSLNEPYYWISTEWLRQWADSITPPVLDNTPILCLHGKAPVSKVGSMKRLSATAWAQLMSKYDGGPELRNDDYCKDCLIDEAQTVVCADSYRDRRTVMRQLALNILSGNCEDGKYHVSKSWLHQWSKRKILDAPCEADAGPTSSIRCPHGQLLPEQAAGAKRVLVPENLWLFLYEDAVSVSPNDHLGCSPFYSDSEKCPQCSNELSEVACLEDTLRLMKQKQRQNHEKLATGKSMPLYLNCKYYLVSSSWITKWRNYVNATGRNASSSAEPEILDGVIASLKCEKHLRLLKRPPELICRRGTILQKLSITDGLIVITEHDWKCFCEEWGGFEERGISAIIECRNSTDQDSAKSCEDIPICVEQQGPHDDGNDENESRRPVIKTSPEVCEDCIGERESCELLQKLNYCNEDITVCFVHGKEVPKLLLEAPDTSFDPDRRISKRSRKTNAGNIISLKVSGCTSMYQLKMMIWESFGIVKENQVLRKGSMLIDGESVTLADLNIFPGDRLVVIDSEIHEHRDIADELSDQKIGLQHTEGGFHGTLLTANISSQIL